MVKYTILIKATTENVASLTVDPDEYVWNIQVKCTNCNEPYDAWQTLCKSVTQPQRIGKGFVHYASKCKFCKKENNIIIEEDSIKPYNGNETDFQPIVTFECRGLEVTAFKIGCGWTVTTQRNSKLTNISLEDDYVEYDEVEGCVSVLDMEYDIRQTR